MGKAAGIIGRNTIKLINGIVNFTALTIAILLLALSGYALWDSEQLYHSADKAQYATYKPTIKDEGKSFTELQAINSDVIAWLSVYGTNIDYPVTQGRDNMKYVTTSVEGEYSASGAIFLDYENNKDFSSFNNIVYGHHMEKSAMFGDIGTFSNKDVFDSHKYGNLYFDGIDHGIEFFSFVHADGYDGSVFMVCKDAEENQTYLNNLLDKAVYRRDLEISEDDKIVMLSTCSSSSTNGRDILIGRITAETFENSFEKNS